MILDEAGLESMMQWTRLALDVRETVIVQGCLAQAVAEIRRQRAVIAELAKMAIRDHAFVRWQQEPNCPAGATMQSKRGRCDCGADAHNARVRELANGNV